MLDFMHSEYDAINILKKDHSIVKELFDQFERSDNPREKKAIAAEVLHELKIHATIEEEVFYPAVRHENEVEDHLMNEADEEHHVAKLLIAELDQMSGMEDHFEAKFHVLAENIRHHIKEEEGRIMPEARHTDIDFDELGQRLLILKRELMEEGIPPSAEERIISLYGRTIDSPAQNKRKLAANPAGKKSVRGSYSSSSRPSLNNRAPLKKKKR
jgi:hypothetical protein